MTTPNATEIIIAAINRRQRPAPTEDEAQREFQRRVKQGLKRSF